ncbi:hypothetical protein [Fidelibacter multiformis]|uniref:hypothetical protein n=1 Tax=Fidelibacter multiformis TaxID=3377529 RepID=UPI0037DC88BC
MIRWIVWPLLVLILFGLLYTWFYGGFSQVNITRSKAGPFTLAYEVHQGDYRDIHIVMDRVFDALNEKDGLFTTQGFGLYYDKPGDVDTDSLRSIGGCILPSDTDPQALTCGCKIAEFPHTDAIVAEFPYRGKASVIFGVMKAYPAINKYLKDHDIPAAPILEIYDVPGKKIRYIVPVGLDSQQLTVFLN